jgi:hypothetical protein
VRWAVVEPYGDNGRYWIYKIEEPDPSIDISILEDKFIEYKPPLLSKIYGDIVTGEIFRKKMRK